MKPATILILCLLLLLAGCAGKGPASPETEEQADSTYVEQEDAAAEEAEPAAELSTAKDGYAAAEAVAKRQDPDAVFIGATGTMDKDGKAESWTYTFDSLKRSKGIEVTDGVWREKTFSFQDEMNTWVDSTKAADACGDGEATLEAGKWTVSGETDTCEIDAKTGEKDEN